MLCLYQYTYIFSTAFEDHCINERLASFYFDSAEYNVNILHNPPKENEHPYLPYIGNGVFGVPIFPEGWLYIKYGRALLLPVQWQPLITHPISKDRDMSLYREATVVHFTNGIVYKYQCLREGYHIDSQYYAHRGLEGILVQNIKLANPYLLSQEIMLKPQESTHWSNSHVEPIK